MNNKSPKEKKAKSKSIKKSKSNDKEKDKIKEKSNPKDEKKEKKTRAKKEKKEKRKVSQKNLQPHTSYSVQIKGKNSKIKNYQLKNLEICTGNYPKTKKKYTKKI